MPSNNPKVDSITEQLSELVVSMMNLKESLPDAIAEGILRGEAVHCITIFGVSEFAATDIIAAIFSVGCIGRNQYRIICRLGRGKKTCRPIKAQLCQGLMNLDFLDEWNTNLQSIPRFRQVRIAKFLTRKELREKREEYHLSDQHPHVSNNPPSLLSFPCPPPQIVMSTPHQLLNQNTNSFVPSAEPLLKLLIDEIREIRGILTWQITAQNK